MKFVDGDKIDKINFNAIAQEMRKIFVRKFSGTNRLYLATFRAYAISALTEIYMSWGKDVS